MTPHFRKQPARQLGALCLAFEHRARVLPLGAGQRRQSERPTEISRPPGYRREPRHPALVPAAVPPCPGPAGTDPASRRFSGTSLLRGTRGVPLLDQRDRREPWSNAAPPAPPQRPPPAGTAHAPRTPAGPPLPLPDHTSAAPRSSMSRSPPTTSCLELDRPRTSGTSEGAPRWEPTSHANCQNGELGEAVRSPLGGAVCVRVRRDGRRVPGGAGAAADRGDGMGCAAA